MLCFPSPRAPVLCSLLCVLLRRIVASSNEFDTYNADECQRVRRPWRSLSDDDKSLYLRGLLKLRENGQGDPDRDEFVGVAMSHDGSLAGDNHEASSFLFYHGYILWFEYSHNYLKTD